MIDYTKGDTLESVKHGKRICIPEEVYNKMMRDLKPLRWFTTDKPLADGWFLFKLKINPKLKWVAVVNDEWVDIHGFKYKNNYEYLSQYRIAGPIPEPEE